ncbi:MAG: peptidylprolyl isomerase [Bacteroidales bacterium]|nr:peptidylprolyl isomerase [Bacteroidales bacterium]
MKKYISILALTLVTSQLILGQSKPEILLTINGNEISKDEFLRIYHKNSSITVDEHKSVNQYLDLFINYKLKVIEAKNLGYDTVPSFIKEMDGYKAQLSKPYLDKNELLDSLLQVAYERQLEEVNADHILYRIKPGASQEDTLLALKTIKEIREKLVNGATKEEIVEEYGGDKNPDIITNELGWFSVFRMVYPFESAAYNTPVGEISQPTLTRYGYHLVIVKDRRKNRGSVKTEHIMTILPKNPTDIDREAAKNKIEKAYSELQNGVDWKDVVNEYSEHEASKRQGGSIGELQSDSKPDIMLDTCFALEAGEYSMPFETPYGFHIVKVDEFIPVPPFEDLKEKYEIRLKNFNFFNEKVKRNRLDNIKKDYRYKFYDENIDALTAVVDSSIYNRNWIPEAAKDLQDPIFTIGDETYSQYDIANILATRRINKKESVEEGVKKIIHQIADDKVLDYGKAHLPEKYPELKYLLEEYNDGILLFNLTEDVVWDKAVKDSTGLEKFYNDLPDKYSWETRIVISKYTYSDSTLTAAILKNAVKRAKKELASDEFSKLICPNDSMPCVTIEVLKYEKGDNAVADSLTWIKGSYLISHENDNTVLYYVENILPPSEKTLTDARGLYTADYQNYLEKQWIEELRNKYNIEVNEKVLEEIRAEEEASNK